MTDRLSDPLLHARLLNRIVMDNTIIDHEEVTRAFPENPGKVELAATYEVRDGKIAAARFISEKITLDPMTATPSNHA